MENKDSGRLEPTSVTNGKFLVTGCQRSGTTVLSMALAAHPSIEIIEEDDPHFHKPGSITKELNLEAMSAHADYSHQIGYKSPRESHRIGEIVRMFPSIKVLWLRRELRQVVSSMLSLTGPAGSWAQVYAPREIEKYLVSSKDVAARRIFEVATKWKCRRSCAVATATLCWVVKEAQRAALEHLGETLISLDYDRLVHNPQQTLGPVLAWLGLPWSSEVLQHDSIVDLSMRPGGTDPRRPIDTNSVNKWRDLLSDQDLLLIGEVRNSYAHPAQIDVGLPAL